MSAGGSYLALLAARASTPSLMPPTRLFPGNPVLPAPLEREPRTQVPGKPTPAETAPWRRSHAAVAPLEPDGAVGETPVPATPVTRDETRLAWEPPAELFTAPRQDETSLQAPPRMVLEPLPVAPPPPSVFGQPVPPAAYRSPSPRPAATQSKGAEPLALRATSIVPPIAPEPPVPAARQPVASMPPSGLAALDQIGGLWQARIANSAGRDTGAARNQGVTIGTLEVRVSTPPPPSPPAPAPRKGMPAPLARGFASFGFRQG